MLSFNFFEFEDVEEWLFVICGFVWKYDVLLDEFGVYVVELCEKLVVLDGSVGDIVVL